LLPIYKSKAYLDITDPKLFGIYKQVALESATQAFSCEHKFGPFSDRCLADWLAENAAKKKDKYI